MSGDEAFSGAEAVARLREAAASGDRYPIAIIDLSVPDMEALTLARLIRSDPRISGTRLIVLAPAEQPVGASEIRELEISAALTKPVKPSALHDALVDAMAGGAARTVARSKPGETRFVRPNIRVLVAEDNPLNRKLAARQLQRFGLAADEVSNGAEAVRAMQRVPYDLVLMDCQMPGMDGFEATRRIRAAEVHGRHTPIVAVTASALEGDRERCLEAGMDDYVSKPVAESEYLRVFDRWLPSRSDPIDATTLETLREIGGNDNFVAELISIYTGEAAKQMAGIGSAIAADDAAALAESAHAFKSSAGHMGARRVRDACEVLERMGRSGPMEGAAAQIRRLEVEHELAIERLRELQSRSVR